MLIYYKIASAECEADKHFNASQNSETFLSLFHSAAEIQPARALPNPGAKSKQQQVASGEPEDACIVHLESELKDAITFLTKNSARIAQMPK